MEAKKDKVERIQVAIQSIQKLMEEEQIGSSSEDDSFAVADDGDDHHRLLCRLLSQLETLTADGKLKQIEPAADPKVLPSPAVGEEKREIANKLDGGGGGGVDDSEREEIVKELRNVKRQNFITHCLLSATIVLTVMLQLSEVSLALKLKDALSHPFRSFGGMLTGMLKGPIEIVQNGENESSKKKQQIQIEAPSLPPLKISELYNLDFSFSSNSKEN